MGLRDFLSKEGRRKMALESRVKKATNKWMQSVDRMSAMEGLAKDGSDEALFGLLKRFGVQCDKTIEDEQEKQWVFETLVSKGKEKTLPPLKRYMKAARSIAWPLRVADKLLEGEELWAILVELLATIEPGYERDPTRKLQLLTVLGDRRDPRVIDAVLPFLEDMNETVRFTSVEALLKQRNDRARSPLLELLVSETEESGRIKARIADGFTNSSWTGKGFRGQVEKALSGEFMLDREGHVKRKKAID